MQAVRRSGRPDGRAARRTSVAIRPYRFCHCADSEPGDCSMRRPFTATAFTLAVLLMPPLAAAPSLAQQGQLPALKPPPPAPIKPYQPVAVTPPTPFADPGFVTFRKQLADVAAHKDRTALAKLIVAKGFFWIQDKDLADQQKTGVDNLARAIALDAKDGPGWEAVAGFANEPSAAELPQQKGVVCGPADPTIDPQAFEALGRATQTDPSEWAYPVKADVEVHTAAQSSAPVSEKLGVNLVRILPDSGEGADPNQPFFLHVATPSGKSGFVDAQSLSPLGGDQMCYAKDANGWKIAGYFGGVAP
jgi:hypothetical protein